jgi:VWFA-related protein
MRVIKVTSSSASLLLFLLLSLGLLTTSVWRAGAQQQNNQQRPRRVANEQKQNQGTTNSNGQTDEVDEGDVVRVDTQLVSVPAVVTNPEGRPLADLKRENFLVYEDGQAQAIANFSTTATPFEIALLLDTSGSTREDVALIRNAANSFVEALRPGDRVAVEAFNTSEDGTNKLAVVDVLTPLTANRDTLKEAIDNLGSSNGTPFYDGLERVISDIFRDSPGPELRGRRAIVALTDGVDSASNSDFATVKSKLLSAGVATYFIQVNTEDFVEDRLMKDCQDDGRLSLSQKQLERYRRIFVPAASREDYANFCQMGPFQRMSISRELYNLARREMNDLAKASGGKNFLAATLQDARAAFSRVAKDIGTQYSLGYYPSNKLRDGKYRAIRVEVKGLKEKASVRAREGYYAPKQ